MSGHSKWHSIKHKKGRADAKRGKAYTQVIKEITVAASPRWRRPGRQSPPSASGPEGQGPQHAQGQHRSRDQEGDRGARRGSIWKKWSMRVMDPGGVAVIIEATTDNKNRTVSELRHLFSKFGGNPE